MVSITLTVDQKSPRSQIVMDRTLVLAVLGLLGFSTVMVFSATLGTHGSGSSVIPLLKHVFSITLGIVIAYLVSQTDMHIWQRSSRAPFSFNLRRSLKCWLCCTWQIIAQESCLS